MAPRCKSCGESCFMTAGSELCRDCRAWEQSQKPEVIRARLADAKKQRERVKKFELVRGAR